MKTLRDKIFSLPVWDTHTHMDVKGEARAKTFWDIAHYFWFLRELQAAGYPSNAETLEAEERADAFIAAFKLCRNTSWSRIFSIILKDLYNVELNDASSVLAADEIIMTNYSRPDWSTSVCDKLNIRKIAVTDNNTSLLADLSQRAFCIPICKLEIEEMVSHIFESDNRKTAAITIKTEIESIVDKLYNSGHRVVRLEPAICENLHIPYPLDIPGEEQIKSGDKQTIESYLWHAALERLNMHSMTVQCFIGMLRAPKVPVCTSVNKTDRILNLHPLFDYYKNITFEFINAGELSSLDLVQTARIYPNVHPGGLWWFSFRPSVFRQNMAYRLEALPAGRCSLVASDAYCVEWCYGKVWLIKDILSKFLDAEVLNGNISAENALFTAGEWLYGGASQIYGVAK